MTSRLDPDLYGQPVSSAVVRLLPATITLLQAFNDDHERFAELIGSAIPDGWPEFPEAVAFTLEYL